MYVLWFMLALMFFYMIKVITGPSAWDRLLGMNLIATKIIIIIIFFSSVNNMSYLLDFAIVYALSGFIGTIFLALFLAARIRGEKNK